MRVARWTMLSLVAVVCAGGLLAGCGNGDGGASGSGGGGGKTIALL